MRYRYSNLKSLDFSIISLSSQPNTLILQKKNRKKSGKKNCIKNNKKKSHTSFKRWIPHTPRIKPHILYFHLPLDIKRIYPYRKKKKKNNEKHSNFKT